MFVESHILLLPMWKTILDCDLTLAVEHCNIQFLLPLSFHFLFSNFRNCFMGMLS